MKGEIKKAKARKEYKCSKCGNVIPKGVLRDAFFDACNELLKKNSYLATQYDVNGSERATAIYNVFNKRIHRNSKKKIT